MPRRSLILSFLIIGAVALLVSAATVATFTYQVTSNGNTFTNGTLFQSVDNVCGLTPDTSARTKGAGGTGGGTACPRGSAGFTTPSNMKPGDSSTHTFTVRNDGSLNGTLTISRTLLSSDNTNCPTSNWTVTTAPAPAALSAGGSTTHAVTVTLNAAAGNGCQGATLTVDYTFDLVQA